MKEIDDTLYSQHDRSDGKAWGRREKKKLTRYNEKRKEKKLEAGIERCHDVYAPGAAPPGLADDGAAGFPSRALTFSR